MNLFDLKGKTAIVTGGNGGIGLGMARGLAAAGARVVVVGRNAEKSERAVAELSAFDTGCFALAVDVTDQTAVPAMVTEVERRAGKLDIIVNNAGINIRKRVEALSLEEWDQVLDSNLKSAFLCCKAAYPALCRAGGGKIINIGSMTSIFGLPFAPAYSASKGGIAQFTRAIATAWATDNIQANAVLPGFIDTELTRTGRAQVPGLEESVVRRTPAGRWGKPDDLSGVAVFLASKASDFVTGALIPIDGGYSSQG